MRQERRFEDTVGVAEPRIIGVTFPDTSSTARKRPRAAPGRLQWLPTE